MFKRHRDSGRKTEAAELHYFSDRLRHKLELMRASSAVIVEAPSGYGKTTALRDYLKSSVPQSADVRWLTAVDEAPAAGFQRLCREIEKIDGRAGDRLLKIGFPNAFTIGETCEALRSIRCSREAWLVIDNFQFLCSGLPHAFLTALMEHGAPELHVVAATQMLSRDTHTAIAGRGFLHITSSDLRLEGEDIRRYYALTGVHITSQEALKVLDYTNGWIIAVYLQLCAFRETGAFSDTAVLTLMEKLVWDKLTGEQQVFFLRLSPFETITARQMCGLLGCDALPDYALNALSSPFILYDPEERRYEPHGIFFELVAQKRAERGEAFERDCLLRAGDLCRSEGKIAEALAFYIQVKAYEQALSLDLSHLIFEVIGNTPFFEITLELAQNCPAEIRKAHLLAMLRVAWALKASGKDAEFGASMDELDGLIPGTGHLRAEWLLLSAYRSYPHLDQMLPVVQKAASLFGGTCSRVILPEALWAFGGYYQMTEFHMKAGEADREADTFEEFIALYSPLTDGHGSGADALFRAELAGLRGDSASSEVFAYKALYLAEGKRQIVVQLGAALTLANTAVLKADAAGWQRAISSLEYVASQASQNTLLVRTVMDTARGSLFVELSAHTRIADWLKSGDFPSHMPAPMSLNAMYVHTLFLLRQRDLGQFIGALEALPREFRKTHVHADFCILFLLAFGYALAGKHEKAAELFDQAAEKGLPDGLILYFVGYSRFLEGFIEELIEKKYPQFLDTFRAVKTQYEPGWQTLHDAVAQDGLPDGLTAREREIALLAADGLHNTEIAKRLSVTESTVRTHLRTIFQKLDIDRRAKLAEKLK